MKKSEIVELMRLKDWPRTRLAAELHIADNTIQKWMAAGQAPDGPAVVHMRLLLRIARGEVRIVETATVPMAPPAAPSNTPATMPA